MKRFLALVLTVALSCMSLPAFATPASSASDDNPLVGSGEYARTLDDLLQAGTYTEGRVLARVNNEFAPIATYSNDAAWSIDALYSYAPDPSAAPRSRTVAPLDRVILIESTTLSTEELLRALADIPGVLMAEPDYVYQLEEPTIAPTSTGASASAAPLQALTNDPRLKDQWYLASINDAPGATNVSTLWSKEGIPGKKLQEVVVAVIDSGVDYTHPDLKDVMWQNPGIEGLPGTYGYDWVDNDDDPMDESAHGTHVAGIIAASMNNAIGGTGMAPNAKIMALRCGNDLGFSMSGVISAYSYMKSAAQNGVPLRAVNDSWGGTTSTILLASVMDDLYTSTGIISICASGNSSQNNDLSPLFPTNYPSEGIISVNAIDAQGSLSYFSDYGASSTDIAAPGVDILSTVPASKGSADLGRTETLVLADSFETSPGLFTPATSGSATAHTKRTEEVWAGAEPSGASIQWTVERAHQGQEAELVFSSASGAARQALAPGKSFDDVRYLAFSAKVLDSSQTAKKRPLRVFVASIKQDEPWIELPLEGYGAAAYGAWSYLAAPLTEEQRNLIDWNNLTIKLARTLSTFEENLSVNIWIDNVLLVEELSPYNSYQGTSMATPVVTGAYALIAGLFPTESSALWRSRILGGVSRMPALWGTCTTDGSLDVMRAASDPFPVVDALEVAQDGSLSATVRGSWFGDQTGRVLLDGKPLAVTSWSSHEISVVLPASLATKLHYVQVERVDGDTGRRGVVMSTGEETTLYEDLPAPPLEELGLFPEQWSVAWSIAAAGGKIYATYPNLSNASGTAYVVSLLVYDPFTKTWALDSAVTNKVENYFLLASHDDILYLFECFPTFQIRSYNPATQTLSDPVDCDAPLRALGYNNHFLSYGSIACDGQSLWLTGATDLSGNALALVTCLDLKTGQATSKTPLPQARIMPTSCIANETLLVVAGNKGVSTSGIVDTLEQLQGDRWLSVPLPGPPSLPSTITPYQNGAGASAVLPAGATIAGTSTPYERLLLTGLTTADLSGSDTYVYDPVTHTWQAIPERLSTTKVSLLSSAVSDNAFYVLGQDEGGQRTIFRRLSFELAPTGPGTQEKPGQTGDATGDTGSDNTQDQLANPEKLAPTGDASAGAVLALVVAVVASGAVCVGVRSRRRVR